MPFRPNEPMLLPPLIERFLRMTVLQTSLAVMLIRTPLTPPVLRMLASVPAPSIVIDFVIVTAP